MLLSLVLGCSSAPTEPPADEPPAQPRFTAPAADWGQADLVLTGAVEARLEGARVQCLLSLRDVHFLASGEQPRAFRIEGFESESARAFRGVDLELDGTRWRWPDSGVPLEGPLAFEATPFSDGEGSTVLATGTLRCPSAEPLPWPPELLAIIEQVAGTPALPFYTRNFGRHQDPSALSVRVRSPSEVAPRLREELGPGWMVWRGVVDDLGDLGGSELVIAPVDSIGEAVWRAQLTPGLSLRQEQVVAWIASHEQAWGLELVQVDTNSIRLAYGPDIELEQATDELLELCPDVLRSKLGSREELLREFERDKQLRCWWD